MSTHYLHIGERLILTWRGKRDARRLSFQYYPSGKPISEEMEADEKADKICSVFIYTEIRAMEAKREYLLTQKKYKTYLMMNGETEKKWHKMPLAEALAELDRQIGILVHKVDSDIYSEVMNICAAEQKKAYMDQAEAVHYANVYARKVSEARLTLNHQIAHMNDAIVELLSEKIRLYECTQANIVALRAKCHSRIFYYYDKASVEYAKRTQINSIIHGEAVDETLLDEIANESAYLDVTKAIEDTKKELQAIKEKSQKLLGQ